MRARKSSGSVWVTKVRELAGVSAWTPGGGRSNRSMRSAGTNGSCRPVIFGAWVKPSFARRLSRISLRLCSCVVSLEWQAAHASCSSEGSCGQARSGAAAASHKTSSSRLAGLARGPRDAPSGRVVRQSGKAARRRSARSDVWPRAARATLHTPRTARAPPHRELHRAPRPPLTA